MHPEIYLEYLFTNYAELDASILLSVEKILEDTNWSAPQTASDFNNLAVLDLITAQYAVDANSRTALVEQAKARLEDGYALDGDLFCLGHYVLLSALLGEYGAIVNLIMKASSDFALEIPAGTLEQESNDKEAQPNKYLLYLPPTDGTESMLMEFFNCKDSNHRLRLFLGEVTRRSPMIFYNSMGNRLLELSLQFSNHNSRSLLMSGITRLMVGMKEGTMWLKNALNSSPYESKLWQAVYLGYLTTGDKIRANLWLERAKIQANELGQEWLWLNGSEQNHTYIPFDQNLILTAEPSFASIVTSVLLGQGDWFEREMEFWRESIQEGMTVIDVGANAGVYTFSAGLRVGHTGLVLAIEPFSKCVQYLTETCKLNQMDWVKICAGAASDSIGRAKLSINSFNELNQVIPLESESDSRNYEEVDCFTLDSLVDMHHLKRVDFLKIDAEGHELQVLKGSQKLLTDFRPIILYENIAGKQGSNLPVAEYLQQVGYQLFLYRPFVRTLVPITDSASFADNLNVIALPPT